MKYLIFLILVFPFQSFSQDQKIKIYKCKSDEGDISFFRDKCPEGTTGEPSNDWVKQPWVQDAKAQLQESMDEFFGPGDIVEDEYIIENVEDFYPDWTELNFKAAAHGLALKRVKECVENQEYTKDLRPGHAAQSCIYNLDQ